MTIWPTLLPKRRMIFERSLSGAPLIFVPNIANFL